MKFIFTADWHIKMWKDEVVSEDGTPLRLNEILSAIRQMCQYAKDHNIDHVIVGGDINDLKNVAHTKAFVLLKRTINEFPDLHFTLLHGNHDSADTMNLHSSIELLKNETNVTCISESIFVDGDITFLPYNRNMKNQIQGAEDGKILVGHLGLNEASLSNGTSLRNQIGLKDFTKFDLVLLGHYHKPQQVGNVYYVGSPIQMRRDEKGEIKRFLVVDSDTLEVESIETRGYRKYHELLIDNDDTTEINKVLGDARQLIDEGNFVTIKKTVNVAIDGAKDGIVITDAFDEDYQIRGITTAMQLDEQMKKYLEIENIPEEKRDVYLRIGLRAIN